MDSVEEETPEGFLTPKAFALSLGTPRAPPLGSAQRVLMLGNDPGRAKLLTSYSCMQQQQRRNEKNEELLHPKIVFQILKDTYHHQKRHNNDIIVHPHLAFDQHRDRLTRWLFPCFSIKFWNSVRDEGYFRFLIDWLVTLGVPMMAIGAPQAVRRFRKLTTDRLQQMRYGNHSLNVIDIFANNIDRHDDQRRRLLVFVHGGAWGSGRSWMYRLVGDRLPDWDVVAIVGYRTYPDADVHGQVDDLHAAKKMLQENFPNHVMSLMGHSSGAHIGLIHIVREAKELLSLKQQQQHDKEFNSIGKVMNPYECYVGLSGPMNVSHHFDYEAARGVEELSPLKPVNGYKREALIQNSPVTQMQQLLRQYKALEFDILQSCFPQHMLLLHGIEDSTVPFTATAEAAYRIRSCGVVGHVDDIYVAKTGHEDVVLQFMMGGSVWQKVTTWLSKQQKSISEGNSSKLQMGATETIIASKL